MEEYNLYENYYVLLRDCTNLEVSRASSKILRRYFRRGREATWRFLESTFLDFQRNYYPCINYNPAQGSLLYSNGPEHCQYPVSTSPIPHSCMNIHYVGTKYMELPDHLKTSKTFSSTTQRSPNLKTSLSLRITSKLRYIYRQRQLSFHSHGRSMFEVTIPIACFPHSRLEDSSSSRRGNQRRARRALRLVSEEGGRKKKF